jgi:short subunit dehydrogenase-like uncharacterized protein
MKIAVYGASGYQGKLVAAELARRNVATVLVGRSMGRLRSAAAASGADGDRAVTTSRAAASGGGPELREASLDDIPALAETLRGCDAVINCAGPFTLSGDAVIRGAVAAGCHYVDTAGEQLYIKGVLDAFGPEAGVTIVPAATDGAVPGDLAAHLLAERIGPIEEITVAHEIVGGGGVSRGSLRSLLATAQTMRSGGLTYEDGSWPADGAIRRASMTFPGATEPTGVVKFALAEVVTIPRHVTVRRVEAVADAALGARLRALGPELLEQIPEGPDEDSRRGQRFTIVVDAVGLDGQPARAVVRGTDTYGTTAVIAVEAARRLASGGTAPGALAPAQAFDPSGFLGFLAACGVTWELTSAEASQGAAAG